MSNYEWEHGLTQTKGSKGMVYYEVWRQGRSGPVQGKVYIIFTAVRGPVKREKEKKLTGGGKLVERLQMLGLHKVVIIALNKREGHNENEFDC